MAAFLALLAFLQDRRRSYRTRQRAGRARREPRRRTGVAGRSREAPAVVALHGCGGPFPSRDGQWAVLLAKAGHIVLLPDSFGSRGLGSQCAVKEREVTPSGCAAATQSTRRGGGMPRNATGRRCADRVVKRRKHRARHGAGRRRSAAGLFQRFAAFYPGCPSADEDIGWKSSAPMLILMGEDDDWTPAPPCHDLAARFPNEISFVAYPGAYHDFDAPNRPVKVRSGAVTAAGGLAHVGTNEPARQDALARLPKWLEEPR